MIVIWPELLWCVLPKPAHCVWICAEDLALSRSLGFVVLGCRIWGFGLGIGDLCLSVGLRDEDLWL